MDELLKPTLRPDLDVSRFDRPWNPSSIVYVAWFGGIAGGGTLFAINARRLGMQDEFKRIVAGTIVLALTLSFAIAWVAGHWSEPGTRGNSSMRIARFGALLIVVFVSKWIARRQQPSYDAYDYSARPKGKLWPYALTAVLLGIIVHGGLYLLARTLLAGASGPHK